MQKAPFLPPFLTIVDVCVPLPPAVGDIVNGHLGGEQEGESGEDEDADDQRGQVGELGLGLVASVAGGRLLLAVPGAAAATTEAASASATAAVSAAADGRGVVAGGELLLGRGVAGAATATAEASAATSKSTSSATGASVVVSASAGAVSPLEVVPVAGGDGGQRDGREERRFHHREMREEGARGTDVDRFKERKGRDRSTEHCSRLKISKSCDVGEDFDLRLYFRYVHTPCFPLFWLNGIQSYAPLRLHNTEGGKIQKARRGSRQPGPSLFPPSLPSLRHIR